jgi:hypothetical protein
LESVEILAKRKNENKSSSCLVMAYVVNSACQLGKPQMEMIIKAKKDSLIRSFKNSRLRTNSV